MDYGASSMIGYGQCNSDEQGGGGGGGGIDETPAIHNNSITITPIIG